MKKENFREKRICPRVQAKLLVHFAHYKRLSRKKTSTTVICSRGEKAFTRSLDLSFGGMMIEVKNPLPKETYLDLRISIEEKIIKATAIIAHVKKNEESGKYGIGLKFLNMPVEHRQILHQFIMKKLDTLYAPLPA